MIYDWTGQALVPLDYEYREALRIQMQREAWVVNDDTGEIVNTLYNQMHGLPRPEHLPRCAPRVPR